MQDGKQTAKKVLEEGWKKAFDFKTMADYDADFYEKGEPVFRRLIGITRGHDFRFIVMHHFLEQVGVGNTFLTMKLVDDKDVFGRLVKHGVIKIGKDTNDLTYSRYKVVVDPRLNLEKHAHSSPDEPCAMNISVMGIGEPIVS
jgi:hypothetical protein